MDRWSPSFAIYKSRNFQRRIAFFGSGGRFKSTRVEIFKGV